MLNGKFVRRAFHLLFILAIFCQNVACLWAWPWTQRKAEFPDASRVARIGVSIVGMPSGTDVRTLSVQDKKQIAEVLAILGQHRDGWKRILTTEPAGIVQITFVSRNATAVRPLCIVRLGKEWVSTDIDGLAHSRAMSLKDQRKLLKTLGVETTVLERGRWEQESKPGRR
jgi:hypothetical protein